jgi:hypothetical protein
LKRFDALVLAYFLIGNHDHFMLHRRHANLSRLMRHLKGVVMQACNRGHRNVGLFSQGHCKDILVGQYAYLLEACAIERMRTALNAA